MSIEVSGLSKSFGGQRAVDGVSFSLPRGGITGFLGPNGAGKSTTLRMVTGYLEPDEGDVTVSGFSIRSQPLEVKRRIGYLPELNPLYPDMYVREYIGFVAELHGLRNARSRVEEAVEATGLRPEARKPIQHLSKGYKQRVGLAAALVHDPEVLVLDEPTSGFDPNQISDIRELVRRLGRDRTILFSSHILQEVEALCERVIIIHRGRIVADSPLADLRSRTGHGRLALLLDKPVGPEAWQSLPADARPASEDGRSWSFESDDPEAMGRALMERCLSHGLNIVSLRTESGTLEEVFRELTR
jgi:ABC-2 type transport system ATP-binding protein